MLEQRAVEAEVRALMQQGRLAEANARLDLVELREAVEAHGAGREQAAGLELELLFERQQRIGEMQQRLGASELLQGRVDELERQLATAERELAGLPDGLVELELALAESRAAGERAREQCGALYSRVLELEAEPSGGGRRVDQEGWLEQEDEPVSAREELLERRLAEAEAREAEGAGAVIVLRRRLAEVEAQLGERAEGSRLGQAMGQVQSQAGQWSQAEQKLQQRIAELEAANIDADGLLERRLAEAEAREAASAEAAIAAGQRLAAAENREAKAAEEAAALNRRLAEAEAQLGERAERAGTENSLARLRQAMGQVQSQVHLGKLSQAEQKLNRRIAELEAELAGAQDGLAERARLERRVAELEELLAGSQARTERLAEAEAELARNQHTQQRLAELEEQLAEALAREQLARLDRYTDGLQLGGEAADAEAGAGRVPSWLVESLDWLEQAGVPEGLWRLSGHRAKANQMEASLKQSGRLPIEPETSSHTVVTVLLRWIAGFQGGLIPPGSANKLVKAASPGMQLTLLRGMPETNRAVLGALLEHWRRVVAEPNSGMDAKAVASSVVLQTFADKMPNREHLSLLQALLEADEITSASLLADPPP